MTLVLARYGAHFRHSVEVTVPEKVAPSSALAVAIRTSVSSTTTSVSVVDTSSETTSLSTTKRTAYASVREPATSIVVALSISVCMA